MGTLSRSIAEKRSNMEEYFKDKSFIVTGASAGKYQNIVQINMFKHTNIRYYSIQL